MAAAIVLVGCSKNVEIPQGTQDISSFETEKLTFHAGFESVDTKTYINDDLHLRWTKDDKITIFQGNTYPTQWIFIGETGDNYADFEDVTPSGFSSGSGLTNEANYAVYPYVKKTEINQTTCAITFTLPAVQQYAPNSIGLGANTMVAVTKDKKDTFLSFKNVGGFVVFSLYGEGTVIKSITFSSQAGETLAGKAEITASNTSDPTVSFTSSLDDTHVSSLTLDCGDGVSLGATQDEAKNFWFVVPPVTLSNGFAVTFTRTDGETITRTASGSKTVERNKIFRIPVKVVFQDFTSNGIETLNEISYEW